MTNWLTSVSYTCLSHIFSSPPPLFLGRSCADHLKGTEPPTETLILPVVDGREGEGTVVVADFLAKPDRVVGCSTCTWLAAWRILNAREIDGTLLKRDVVHNIFGEFGGAFGKSSQLTFGHIGAGCTWLRGVGVIRICHMG